MTGSRQFPDQNSARIIMRELTKERKKHHDNVFYITRDLDPSGKSKPLRWFAVGCHGEKNGGNTVMADLMYRIAREGRPDFIILLGDNVYSKGVDSPDAEQFQSLFYDIYAKLLALDIPFIVILGNHDGNYKKHLLPGRVRHKSKELNQVYHTFWDMHEQTQRNLELLRRDRFHLSELRGWIMPDRWFSIVVEGNGSPEEKELQFFCLDSNNLAKHYLRDWQRKREGRVTTPDNDNQMAWLEKQYKAAANAGRELVLVKHHPHHFPVDKRAYPAKEDSRHYLTEAQHHSLTDISGGMTGFNQLLNFVLTSALKMKFSLSLAAHTHAAMVIKDGDTLHVTLGNGGGSLQDQQYFGRPEQVGCYVDEYGFGDFTFQPSDGKIVVNIRTTHPTLDDANHIDHIRFISPSHVPIVEPADPEEKEQTDRLRVLILQACRSYQATFQAEQEKKDHTLVGQATQMTFQFGANFCNNWLGTNITPDLSHRVKDMHRLVNYCIQYKSLPYNQMYTGLSLILESMVYKSEGSLYRLIRDRLSLLSTRSRTLTDSFSSFQHIPSH